MWNRSIDTCRIQGISFHHQTKKCIKNEKKILNRYFVILKEIKISKQHIYNYLVMSLFKSISSSFKTFLNDKDINNKMIHYSLVVFPISCFIMFESYSFISKVHNGHFLEMCKFFYGKNVTLSITIRFFYYYLQNFYS